MYNLKDQLKQIWRYQSPGWARRALEECRELTETSGITPLASFARNLWCHADRIINHCRHPLHTGRLERISNKIKVIKRMTYGFHDDSYFMLKIKGAFPRELKPHPE